MDYRMLGYRQFEYMLSREIRRANWYNKLWVCDTMNGDVQGINLPIKLRRFEACIASDNLYIIDRTPALRLRNPDVYCYNLKNKNAYIVGNNSSTILKFEDTKKLVKDYPLQCTVFSNDDFIYIKGSNLIKLQQVEETLVVVDCKSLKSVCCDRMESVICDKNTVFTLYKQNTVDGMSITLEQLNLQSPETEIVIEHIISNDEEKGIPLSRLFNMLPCRKRILYN